MSYATIEAAWVTLCQTVTGMSASTVSAGDDSILDRGITSGIIIDAGRGPIMEEGADRSYRFVTWDLTTTIVVRHTSRKAAHDNLIALRSNLLAFWQKYPTLNCASVTNSLLSGDTPPGDIPLNVNEIQAGPAFRAQELTLTVTELVPISGGEI